MPYTEVERKSWFSRIIGSLVGILFGLVLFGAGIVLLWWNEGRSVRTAQGLRELARAVVSVPSDRVDRQHEGQPVHVTGKATADAILHDDLFGVSAPAIKLRRTVEMYQWEEDEQTKTRRETGGSTRTERTYTYRKVWSTRRIDSGGFKESGHGNPSSWPFGSDEWTADGVRLGAFTLSSDLVAQMSNYHALPAGEKELNEIAPDLAKTLLLHQGGFYRGRDPSGPQVGDMRVRFDVVRPGSVSVIARQVRDTFEPWTSRSGTEVSRLMEGTVSAESMVGTMQRENTYLTWGLRLGGFLALALGVGLILGPIAVLADILPILGTITRGGVFLIAVLVAGFAWLVTVALAWLVYRPVLAIILLAAAVGIVMLAFALLRRRRGPRPSTVPPPPLPPLPPLPQ